MARAVVLYFESNTDADDFVKEYDAGTKFGDDELKGWVDEIIGVYPVPTQFCDPSTPEHRGKGKTGRGYGRGTKFGWWVCHVCAKPYKARNLESLVRAVVSQAVDFLPVIRGESDTPKARPY